VTSSLVRVNTRKLIYTLLIILVGGIAATGVADDVSNTHAEEALKRALTTFAVSRTLNGVISVAQGTEVALEPGGVGVMLTPGQILDPINDLVERFSSVMLIAASSLGLQIVLLDILSWWVLTAALIVSLAAVLVFMWSPALKDHKYVNVIPKVALVFLILRFALPVIIVCTNFVFDTFLLTKHDAAAGVLSASAQQIEQISTEIDDVEGADGGPVAPGNDGESGSAEDGSEPFVFPGIDELAAGIRDSVVNMYSGASDWIRSNSVSEKMQALKESASRATSHIIDLIVIFVLQTIVFPVAFLWLFVEALKALASRSFNAVSKAG
jgi:hypothetical protein